MKVLSEFFSKELETIAKKTIIDPPFGVIQETTLSLPTLPPPTQPHPTHTRHQTTVTSCIDLMRLGMLSSRLSRCLPCSSLNNVFLSLIPFYFHLQQCSGAIACLVYMYKVHTYICAWHQDEILRSAFFFWYISSEKEKQKMWTQYPRPWIQRLDFSK